MNNKTHWLKQYVRRNERLLVILGGFVVLTTFIVKDLVRENLKDLKDSLTETEHFVRIRAQFITVRKQLKAIDQRITVANPPQPATEHAIELGRRLFEEDAKLQDYKESIMEEMENVEELAAQLSLTKQDLGDLAKIREKADTVIADPYLSKAGDPEYVVPEITRRADRARDVEEDLFENIRGVLETAGEQEAIRERRYRYVNIASYVLLSIGALMSLLGRICGIDGMKEGVQTKRCLRVASCSGSMGIRFVTFD